MPFAARSAEAELLALLDGVSVSALYGDLSDLDVDAAARLAAARGGIGLAVCHNRLFDPAFAAAGRAVADAADADAANAEQVSPA